MKTKLDPKISNAELSVLVAEHVANIPYSEYPDDGIGLRIPPQYATQADSVLPLFEARCAARRPIMDSLWYSKTGNYWTLEAHYHDKEKERREDIFLTGGDGSVPRLLSLALLLATGKFELGR